MKNNPLLDEALEAIGALRSDGAHVHSITNSVAQNFTANVLLACGATVSMTANPVEVESFTANAKALHINLGTLDSNRIEAMRKASQVAESCSIPVTLDPVMIHLSNLRREIACELAGRSQMVRGNAKEIAALGIDDTEVCLVKTGKADEIAKNGTTVRVENGHPVMARVIATGCALGALISALSSKTDNPVAAALAGVLWFSVSGEIAAGKVSGPGSFQPAFLDELHTIPIDVIRREARLR